VNQAEGDVMGESESVAADGVLSRDEILTRLRALLKDVLDLESADAIQPGTRLREDLHIDSLGMLDVVIEVEASFGLKLASDINLFEEIVTVGDAMTLIERSRSGSRQG
jgi:acyl carrier protein